MSRPTLGGLKLITISKMATKEEVLAAILSTCDEDFNGNNGEEYVDPDYLAAGFSSNASYYFEEEWEKDNHYGRIIASVLEAQYESDSSYYEDYEVEYEETPTHYIVATTHLH